MPDLRGMYAASIHAPARGATRIHAGGLFQDVCFNPRSRTGSDPARGAPLARQLLLQSTLPHGERPFWPQALSACCSFNPRSRTGSDKAKLAARGEWGASIHAPARGATIVSRHSRPLWNASIHAPARGATVGGSLHPPIVTGFNPRSRTGSDLQLRCWF